MIAMAEQYQLDDVIHKLENYCAKYPTKGEAAVSLGVSRVFLWRVLNKETVPTDSILKHIGMKRERHVSYTYREA
jgi:hypothetical protein